MSKAHKPDYERGDLHLNVLKMQMLRYCIIRIHTWTWRPRVNDTVPLTWCLNAPAPAAGAGCGAEPIGCAVKTLWRLPSLRRNSRDYSTLSASPFRGRPSTLWVNCASTRFHPIPFQFQPTLKARISLTPHTCPTCPVSYQLPRQSCVQIICSLETFRKGPRLNNNSGSELYRMYDLTSAKTKRDMAGVVGELRETEGLLKGGGRRGGSEGAGGEGDTVFIGVDDLRG